MDFIRTSYPGIDQRWQDAAAAFHARNPHVYAYLVRFAREALQAGRRRLGIELLFNRLRWEVFMTTAGDEFKLNQNFKAWYARKIMEGEADLAGMFVTRSMGKARAA